LSSSRRRLHWPAISFQTIWFRSTCSGLQLWLKYTEYFDVPSSIESCPRASSRKGLQAKHSFASKSQTHENRLLEWLDRELTKHDPACAIPRNPQRRLPELPGAEHLLPARA